MGGCQNYGPFLGTQNIRCRIIIRTPKGPITFDNHPYGALSMTRSIGCYWMECYSLQQAEGSVLAESLKSSIGGKFPTEGSGYRV